MRGNIRRRTKDTWTLQVDSGKDSATGKKGYVSRTFRGSKKDAEAAWQAWSEPRRRGSISRLRG